MTNETNSRRAHRRSGNPAGNNQLSTNFAPLKNGRFDPGRPCCDLFLCCDLL